MSIVAKSLGNSIGSKNGRYVHGRRTTGFEHFCIDCNKKLVDYRAILCRSCVTRKRFKNPQNHPAYIDGRSNIRYPKQFRVKRLEIIKRDKERCQLCKMSRSEHRAKYGRDIEVHHIDHNKKNLSDDNLVTLCKPCNLKDNHKLYL
jgi:5-methylcytosine-specific restriction endonuclease McrA